ncbi:hypothetical protein GDO86_008892, partial [Hymenochirus boettgeri]
EPAPHSASPDLPAARSVAQDCARFLLLCPGELSQWEESSRGVLFTRFLREPGLLHTATDMVCKRKNSGGSHQPDTPCKQPRCAPTEGEHMAQQAADEGQIGNNHVEDGGMAEDGLAVNHPAKDGQTTPFFCKAGQTVYYSTSLAPKMPSVSEGRQASWEGIMAGPVVPHDIIPVVTTLVETRPALPDNMARPAITHCPEDEPCCSALSPSVKALSCKENESLFTLQTPCSPEHDLKTQEKLASETVGPCDALHINQLPSSLLLKIFSNLTLSERCFSASLVCKYWRDLCLDFQFWKQLDLSNRQVKDNLLEEIASRSQNVTEINISDCTSVSDQGVCMVALKCPRLLKYIAYRCKQLSDTSLIALATHCTSLQKVHVGNQDKLTDEALIQLGTRCKELTDLHFGQCYKISDEGMIAIAKGSKKLKKIYMQENKLTRSISV